MTRLTKISGICPAVFVLYTDATCRKIDEKAQRAHYRKLIDHGVDALVVGGHAGEIVSLNPEERMFVIQMAKEEAKGRIPVVGGVVADSTAEAIAMARDAQQAGADAVLFTPPCVPGWKAEVEFLLHHYGAVEEAVGIPTILFASPSDRYGTQYMITPADMTTLLKALPSVIGAKITAQWDMGGFMRIARAMREVRDVGCLKAGGQAQFVHYAYGADGSLSGGTNFSPADDIQVLKLVKQGKTFEAQKLSDSWMPVYDTIYGTQVGLPVVYFHYRYKVTAWLTGAIDAPWMRLPQMPPPLRDIEMLRDALLRAEKPMVRQNLAPLPVSAI